jgi:uncharacterized membrane protein
MDDDRDADRPSPNAETSGIDRLVFFSDAVFAIAMTLLVLPLIGRGGSANIWERLHVQSGQLYAFAVSFWVIGLYWLGHHRLYRRIRAYDETLMFLNLFLLFTIAFLPYPTAMTGRYPDSVGATVFYALCLSTVGLTTTACIWYAFIHRGLAEVEPRDDATVPDPFADRAGDLPAVDRGRVRERRGRSRVVVDRVPRRGPVSALRRPTAVGRTLEAGLAPVGKVRRGVLERREDLLEDLSRERGRLALLPAHRTAHRRGGDLDGLLEQRPVVLACHVGRPPAGRGR